MVPLFSTAPCGWHAGSGGKSRVTCGAWGNGQGAKVVDNWDFSPPPFPTVFNQLSVWPASRLQSSRQAANSILGWTGLDCVFDTHFSYSLLFFFSSLFPLSFLFSICSSFPLVWVPLANLSKLRGKVSLTHCFSLTHTVCISLLSLSCNFWLLTFIDYLPCFYFVFNKHFLSPCETSCIMKDSM